ncbi:MAG: ABC transporter ATP-binding protein [Candidatus Aminicenantes bacterium]|nr:ABC transporter ATP-binding protein [Candidatus Aminicenantes bacterium]
MKTILEIKKLRKEYDEFVLDSIDWNIPEGFITGLIGPNGAGKTTTIKLILNQIEADSGFIKIFGKDHTYDEIAIKNRIGYVGEQQYFYESKSANWTGKFVSHFFSQWDMEKYHKLLDDFQIPQKKMIRKFSKGMKVKLSMAIALSHHADLIILDEPTSGLDPIVRREVLDLLRKITDEENTTVVISSHITDDIERIADFITYMIKGRIAKTASKDDLRDNWKKIHFIKDSIDQKVIESLENIEDHMFGCSAITKEYIKIKDALIQGVASGDIKVESLGLDDILISLVKEK